MNSITIHILGAFVDAAMKSTTFGWRSDVITRTCNGDPPFRIGDEIGAKRKEG
jgi:hypothetical protein